jgi:hypothetical protein
MATLNRLSGVDGSESKSYWYNQQKELPTRFGQDRDRSLC